MANAQRRTVEQMIEAGKANLAKLEARAALKAAQSNPALAPLVAALAALKLGRSQAGQVLSTGTNSPQAADNRIRVHDLWIAEIEAKRARCEATVAEGDALETRYGEALSFLAGGMIDGTIPESDAADTVQALMAEAEGSSTVPELQAAEDAATEYRKAFSATLKGETAEE